LVAGNRPPYEGSVYLLRSLRLVRNTCFYFLPLLYSFFAFAYWPHLFVIAKVFALPVEFLLGLEIPSFLLHLVVLGTYVVSGYVALCIFTQTVVTISWAAVFVYCSHMTLKRLRGVQLDGDQLGLAEGIRLYTELEICFKIAVRTTASFLRMSHFIFSSITTGGLYLALGNHSAHHYRLFGAFAVVIVGGPVTFLNFLLGRVYSQSIRLVQSWAEASSQKASMNRLNWKLMLLSSLRPLKIYIGDQFFIDEKNVLVFCNDSGQMAIDLLLSYPPKHLNL